RELHGVEQDSSLFRVEPAVQQVIADLTKRSLDRIGIFEEGQEERRGRERGGPGKILENGALAIVIVTELLVAEGGRSALRSVGFDVLTLGDGISGHYDCSWIGSSSQSWVPPPPYISWSFRISGLAARPWD